MRAIQEGDEKRRKGEEMEAEESTGGERG